MYPFILIRIKRKTLIYFNKINFSVVKLSLSQTYKKKLVALIYKFSVLTSFPSFVAGEYSTYRNQTEMCQSKEMISTSRDFYHRYQF